MCIPVGQRTRPGGCRCSGPSGQAVGLRHINNRSYKGVNISSAVDAIVKKPAIHRRVCMDRPVVPFQKLVVPNVIRPTPLVLRPIRKHVVVPVRRLSVDQGVRSTGHPFAATTKQFGPGAACSVTAAAATFVTLARVVRQTHPSLCPRPENWQLLHQHTATNSQSHMVAPSASTVATNSTIQCAYAQFAAGALGGSTATYSTHWLDTIKVKMQASPQSYTGGLDCVRHTLRHEGFTGLYQGATPAVAGHACKAAMVFMCYGICEEAVRRICGNSKDHVTVTQHAAAGAMTGVIASFILCPMDLIKCRMQAMAEAVASLDSAKQQKIQSPLRVARMILVQDGPRGLYRGLSGIWSKEIPGSFIYFGSYEMSKSFVLKFNCRRTLTSQEVFVCGVFAGLCFCSMHPVETAKTRVQLMENRVSFFKAFYQIIKTEGIAPLFSGLRPSMIRACVFSGIQFLTFEMARDFILHKQEKG